MKTLQAMWAVIIASMLPYLELRGAIPLACRLGLSAPEAFVISVAGNMLPVIPIMMLIDPVSKWLDHIPLFHRFFNSLFTRCRRRQAEVNKYGFWGLAVFVAIPLPMTGAWSGAVIAFLMGMRKRIAFFSILLGVMVAGMVVTFLTYGLAHVLSGG